MKRDGPCQSGYGRAAYDDGKWWRRIRRFSSIRTYYIGVKCQSTSLQYKTNSTEKIGKKEEKYIVKEERKCLSVNEEVVF